MEIVKRDYKRLYREMTNLNDHFIADFMTSIYNEINLNADFKDILLSNTTPKKLLANFGRTIFL
ncbi:MAG: hypothetical protein QXV17_13065 [Candidatus Micrarchaeaceae archaeon]